MIYIKTENGYIVDCIEYAHKGYIPTSAKNPPDILNGCYRLIEDNFVLDTDKYALFVEEQKQQEEQGAAPQTAEELKAVLESTDYKIIKCVEYQLIGLKIPYDIVSLHEERQALRDQINQLESNEVEQST